MHTQLNNWCVNCYVFTFSLSQGHSRFSIWRFVRFTFDQKLLFYRFLCIPVHNPFFFYFSICAYSKHAIPLNKSKDHRYKRAIQIQLHLHFWLSPCAQSCIAYPWIFILKSFQLTMDNGYKNFQTHLRSVPKKNMKIIAIVNVKNLTVPSQTGKGNILCFGGQNCKWL